MAAGVYLLDSTKPLCAHASVPYNALSRGVLAQLLSACKGSRWSKAGRSTSNVTTMTARPWSPWAVGDVRKAYPRARPSACSSHRRTGKNASSAYTRARANPKHGDVRLQASTRESRPLPTGLLPEAGNRCSGARRPAEPPVCTRPQGTQPDALPPTSRAIPRRRIGWHRRRACLSAANNGAEAYLHEPRRQTSRGRLSRTVRARGIAIGSQPSDFASASCAASLTNSTAAGTSFLRRASLADKQAHPHALTAPVRPSRDHGTSRDAGLAQAHTATFQMRRPRMSGALAGL
jgi:hypothetical protein